MATITPVNTRVDNLDENCRLWTWPNMLTAATDGIAIEQTQHADLCWQAVGATWGGATVAVQGSNDGVNWFPLTNASGGAAATFTANGGKQTIERPRYVRPQLTTAGTAADITVTLLARKTPNTRK